MLKHCVLHHLGIDRVDPTPCCRGLGDPTPHCKGINDPIPHCKGLGDNTHYCKGLTETVVMIDLEYQFGRI